MEYLERHESRST